MDSKLFQWCDTQMPRSADRRDVERCHGQSHARWIDTIDASADASDEHLEALRAILRHPDIYVTRDTGRAALTACGATLTLVDLLLANTYRRAFAIVRPPGHHAGCGGPAGFCFINNVMCAALRAADAGERVAIVDIDVHFGDGTVDLMVHHAANNEQLAYFSIHRYDNGTFYPQDERAAGRPIAALADRFVAVPFNGSADDAKYRNLLEDQLLPALQRFAPTLILVSAGYDACVGDPLGECALTPTFYGEIFNRLLDVCPRLLAVLEGGYNIDATVAAALASIEVLIRHR
jgi:histone deacetylase 6